MLCKKTGIQYYAFKHLVENDCQKIRYLFFKQVVSVKIPVFTVEYI